MPDVDYMGNDNKNKIENEERGMGQGGICSWYLKTSLLILCLLRLPWSHNVALALLLFFFLTLLIGVKKSFSCWSLALFLYILYTWVVFPFSLGSFHI